MPATSGITQVTATRNDKSVKAGEKNSWGTKDRNALYLAYPLPAIKDSTVRCNLESLTMLKKEKSIK